MLHCLNKNWNERGEFHQFYSQVFIYVIMSRCSLIISIIVGNVFMVVRTTGNLHRAYVFSVQIQFSCLCSLRFQRNNCIITKLIYWRKYNNNNNFRWPNYHRLTQKNCAVLSMRPLCLDDLTSKFQTDILYCSDTVFEEIDYRYGCSWS